MGDDSTLSPGSFYDSSLRSEEHAANAACLQAD
jgi:hypothetical protein